MSRWQKENVIVTEKEGFYIPELKVLSAEC